MLSWISLLLLWSWLCVWSRAQLLDHESWLDWPSLSNGLCRYGNSLECCWGWRQMEGGHCQPYCQQGCKHGECVGPDRCKCHPGYSGKACNQDLNECGLKPRPCKHRCMNTVGSYKCYCADGYTLQPDGSCRNARTCYHANCQYGCEVSKGAVRCTCPSPGLRLGPDKRSCVDIDECRSGGGVCPRHRKCVNTFGSFVCKCHLGFKLTYVSGRYICIDKDTRPFCSLNPSSPKCRCEDGSCAAVPRVSVEPQRPRTTTPMIPGSTAPPPPRTTAQLITTATITRAAVTHHAPITTTPITSTLNTISPPSTTTSTTTTSTTSTTTTHRSTTLLTTIFTTSTLSTTTPTTTTSTTLMTTTPTTTTSTTTTLTTTTPTSTTSTTTTSTSIMSPTTIPSTSTFTTTTPPTTTPTTTASTTLSMTTPTSTTPTTTTPLTVTTTVEAVATTVVLNTTVLPTTISMVTTTFNNRVNKDVTHKQRGDVHIPRHPTNNQVWDFDIELGNKAEDTRDDPEAGVLHCTFDHGVCDWLSDKEGDLHWETFHNPAGGRSLSVPELKPGQTSTRGARLAVHIVPPWSHGNLCISFSHWLTGRGVGALQLFIRRRGRGQRYSPALWGRTGGHGWRHTQLTLMTHPLDRVLLKAERTQGRRGQIAVDDVTLRRGSC